MLAACRSISDQAQLRQALQSCRMDQHQGAMMSRRINAPPSSSPDRRPARLGSASGLRANTCTPASSQAPTRRQEKPGHVALAGQARIDLDARVSQVLMPSSPSISSVAATMPPASCSGAIDGRLSRKVTAISRARSAHVQEQKSQGQADRRVHGQRQRQHGFRIARGVQRQAAQA